MYYDFEGCVYVTTEQLFAEYLMAIQEGVIEADMSFKDYLKNSMASNGGTLQTA